MAIVNKITGREMTKEEMNVIVNKAEAVLYERYGDRPNSVNMLIAINNDSFTEVFIYQEKKLAQLNLSATTEKVMNDFNYTSQLMRDTIQLIFIVMIERQIERFIKKPY